MWLTFLATAFLGIVMIAVGEKLESRGDNWPWSLFAWILWLGLLWGFVHVGLI